ncbi:MAG: hypothetical protein M3O50_06785 [Myxococcota bacterium]|nr:hypothetical protein [Myxococcota bacterium]
MRSTFDRTVCAIALAASVLSFAVAARTEPSAGRGTACKAAYLTAKERERSGRLREAREHLLVCANAVCDRTLRRTCAAEVTQLDTVDLPSIIPVVTDVTGAPTSDVQITMDGELLASRLDGQPIHVDPGLHEFSFVPKGEPPIIQRLMILQGQQDRRISISLLSTASAGTAVNEPPAPIPVAMPAPASPPAPVSGRRSPLPLLLGAAGVACAETAALVVFLEKEETLPRAADAVVGVSIGVATAALMATAWAFLRPRAVEAKSASGALTARPAMQAVRSGAIVGVSASF